MRIIDKITYWLTCTQWSASETANEVVELERITLAERRKVRALRDGVVRWWQHRARPRLDDVQTVRRSGATQRSAS